MVGLKSVTASKHGIGWANEVPLHHLSRPTNVSDYESGARNGRTCPRGSGMDTFDEVTIQHWDNYEFYGT